MFVYQISLLIANPSPTSKISDPTNINKNISIANLPKQITLEEIYDYGKELEQLFPESSETDDLEL